MCPTSRFHLLIISCLLKMMIRSLIMKIEKNFKLEKMLKCKNAKVFSKFETQAFKAGGF